MAGDIGTRSGVFRQKRGLSQEEVLSALEKLEAPFIRFGWTTMPALSRHHSRTDPYERRTKGARIVSQSVVGDMP